MDDGGQIDIDFRRIEREAIAVASRELLRESLTGCLTISGLATWFDVDRATMKTLLPMIGAEPCGRFWRVPIRKMPPEYLLAIGFPVEGK